jgi:methyl-accepting chemotaxis protein
MNSQWTFGQKLGAGFALVVAITLALGWLAVSSFKTILADKDRVLAVNAENMLEAQRLESALNAMSSASRGYFLTREDKFLDNLAEGKADYAAAMTKLKQNNPEARETLAAMEQVQDDWYKAGEKIIALRRSRAVSDPVAKVFDTEMYPLRQDLKRRIATFTDEQERLLTEATQASARKAANAVTSMNWLTLLAVGAAVLLALLLTGVLTRQIGAAIQHVQSSSSELQAAANQQAAGSREQSSSMTEIATTISELLATSRQIAESAQRVAAISLETAQAAGKGEQTVQKAQDSVGAIRRQVDLIVGHMLDLGKKSQQIGGILEIINELAEQTNILSINASVEAAGAGEAGRRFGVVADEIRKLADRVGGSTKEIRGLIDEVRAAVNTTVMATEGGAKTAESGTRQFAEVVGALQNISSLVGTSTEAAREIELSTKQQATAVEQVNVAIANVAQATRETEASSNQTLQTAMELTHLSKDLARLVQASKA